MTLSKSVSKRLKSQSDGAPTFSDQAATWLRNGANRKREPMRPKTVSTYLSQIETNLNPIIGQLPLDVIGNAVVKDVVSQLVQKNLSPATIALNINIIKEIRSSAKNQDAEELYPYKWNAEAIDAPVLNKKAQRRPIASAQAVQDAISKDCRGVGALAAVLAGSGLRIQEALAITGGYDDQKSNFWDGDKIIVRCQRTGNTLIETKTQAGVREVDLHSSLNLYLKQKFAGLTGYMFPKSENFYRQRLVNCGIVGGFHSLRRFRVTHLRIEGVPDPMVHFWIGHEDETVTDGYTIVKDEIERRKILVEKAGLGFTLPEAL